MIILFCMLAYIIGTLPSGLICAELFKLGDLRQIGSGNTGATNVLRTGNKFAAFLTLLLDALKGTIAVLLWHIGSYVGIELNETHAVIFGGCAFLGHVFPIWYGFKGGKGVATYLGLLFGMNFMFGVFACILWLVGAFLSKISSIGALHMAVLMPVLLYIGQENNVIPIILALLSCVLIFKHKANIQRIIQKTEPKIGQK